MTHLREEFQDLLIRADYDSYQYTAKRLKFEAFLKTATPDALHTYLSDIEAQRDKFNILTSFKLARQFASTHLLDIYFNRYPEKHLLDLREKKVFLELVEKTSPENLLYILNHPDVVFKTEHLSFGFLKLCSTNPFSEQYPSLEYFVRFCYEHQHVHFSNDDIVEGFFRQLKTFESNMVNLKLNTEIKEGTMLSFFIFQLNMKPTLELENYLKEAQLDYVLELIATRDMKMRLDETLDMKPINRKSKI